MIYQPDDFKIPNFDLLNCLPGDCRQLEMT